MKIVLIGSSGRMGEEIKSLCAASSDVEVVAGVSQEGDAKMISDVSVDADLVIDFSLPSAFESVVQWCRKNKTPLVSGTTGISGEHFKLIEEASKDIPILWSSNMSLGVAFVNSLISQYSAISEDFDFQIEEHHHKHKVDKPSGTAKTMKENLDAAVGRETPEVLAVRGGGIFGVHKVFAMSDEETITLEHTALNRTVFAKGALVAAKWLQGKPAGKYTIHQVLFE